MGQVLNNCGVSSSVGYDNNRSASLCPSSHKDLDSSRTYRINKGRPRGLSDTPPADEDMFLELESALGFHEYYFSDLA